MARSGALRNRRRSSSNVAEQSTTRREGVATNNRADNRASAGMQMRRSVVRRAARNGSNLSRPTAGDYPQMPVLRCRKKSSGLVPYIVGNKHVLDPMNVVCEVRHSNYAHDLRALGRFLPVVCFVRIFRRILSCQQRHREGTRERRPRCPPLARTECCEQPALRT